MAVSTASNNVATTRPSISALQRHTVIEVRGEDGTPGELVYPINYRELYNLKGRLLTVIDATFTDPQQRKAQKDVIWQALQHWMHDVIRDCGGEAGGVTHHDDNAPLSG